MSKKQFAIFGNPVAHSISPIIQNSAFEACDFDAEYSKIHLEDGSKLKEVFLAQNLSGANITVPHKLDAFNQIDEVRGIGAKIGAINTIIKEDDKLIGYNTDAGGFYEAISEFNQSTPIKTALLLGAGGTAKAISLILQENGIRVTILNRSKARLKEFIDSGFECYTFDEFELKQNYDLIINSTSAGLSDDSLPLKKELLISIFDRANFAIDCIYSKDGIPTPFLSLASECEIPNKDGTDMLINQGVLACEYFMNEFDKRDIIYNTMKESLKSS
jgi:shikimate dehydrogenase